MENLSSITNIKLSEECRRCKRLKNAGGECLGKTKLISTCILHKSFEKRHQKKMV